MTDTRQPQTDPSVHEGLDMLSTTAAMERVEAAKMISARDRDAMPGFLSTASAVLPDGNGGFQPCPELLTETEAIRYLRLDLEGPTKPALTLRYYREKGLLRATRVGRRLRYRRVELDRLLEHLTAQSKAFARSPDS